MNSQNASVNLLGRGFSESGVSVAAAGEVNGDVNGGLGLSIEHLAAFAERFDAREARRVADARRGGNFYGPFCGDFHFRLDDVFGPVAAAGGGVARGGDMLQRGPGGG